MNRLFLKKHTPAISIAVFIILYAALSHIKPSLMFNDDGSLRQFGIGYRSKTIFPAWLIAIIIAILSYLAVLSYATM